MKLLLLVAAVAFATASLVAPTCEDGMASAVIESGFCPTMWKLGGGSYRGIIVSSDNDVLVVEKTSGTVKRMVDSDGNGKADTVYTIAGVQGLNHGVTLDNDEQYLYASSARAVYRWPWTKNPTDLLGEPQLVIHSVPCCHHVTRTIRFDSSGRLYVHVGSSSNLDHDTSHARVNRFDVTEVPTGGIDWNTGYTFVQGLRNEVGLRFDRFGSLWGVENGVDNLFREDLGGDIHMDNPAEELNMLSDNGQSNFYGYPYCWSVGDLEGYVPGTQMADPNFPAWTDDMCQNSSSVNPPAFTFPAHNAPLDILFWDSDDFPENYKYDAFVAMHGSWDRQPPSGYNVYHVEFSSVGHPVYSQIFMQYKGPGATNRRQWIRPVGLGKYNHNGKDCLLLTSDSPGAIVMICHD